MSQVESNNDRPEVTCNNTRLPAYFVVSYFVNPQLMWIKSNTLKLELPVLLLISQGLMYPTLASNKLYLTYYKFSLSGCIITCFANQAQAFSNLFLDLHQVGFTYRQLKKTVLTN